MPLLAVDEAPYSTTFGFDVLTCFMTAAGGGKLMLFGGFEESFCAATTASEGSCNYFWGESVRFWARLTMADGFTLFEFILDPELPLFCPKMAVPESIGSKRDEVVS